MRYLKLGSSGLRVSELCLGAMTFGEEWGTGANKQTSQEIVEKFLDAGGNFIDTANYYTNGTSERFLGEFLKHEREKYVLATKFTLSMDKSHLNGGGNHRKNIREALEGSLKRLNMDYIDLYWLHAWDFTTSVEEVMRTLDDLVSSGKVLYIGVSDTPAWIVSQANTLAKLRGWEPFVALQLEYSLTQRTVERELLPMAKAFDLGVLAWAPLAAGLLTGKYNANAPANDEPKRMTAQSARMTERNFAIADAVQQIAQQLGKSPAQVALNWVRAQQGRADVIPILGARKTQQMVDNLGCLSFELPAEALTRLDEVSAIEMGFPHDMIQGANVKNIIFGEKGDKFLF